MTVQFVVDHPRDLAAMFGARAETARRMADSITAARARAEWDAAAKAWDEAASIAARTLLVRDFSITGGMTAKGDVVVVPLAIEGVSAGPAEDQQQEAAQ